MRTTVISSFGPAGYEQYGQRFIETLDRHLPGEIEMLIYAEAEFPHNPEGRLEVRPLFGIDICADFIDRFVDDPLASGRQPTDAWKAKDRRAGYSFKTDAVKFCRKVFAIADAARKMREPGLLVWLDADVVTLDRVPSSLFRDLLLDYDAAYLGRDGVHSECGFLAFRMPHALPLISLWESYYSTGCFLKEREFHDSYLFDLARAGTPNLPCRNLTPGGRGHVWVNSPLGAVFDHCKGQRKLLGYSPERLGRPPYVEDQR